MVEYRTTLAEDLVLLYLSNTTPANKGAEKQDAEDSRTYIEICFDLCEDCHLSRMSSIPQGMFAAKKMRENMEKTMISRINKAEGPHPQKYFNTKLMELSPLKYNSKLMNSIWGLYNRYSPHNIKRTNDEAGNNGDLQQVPTVNLPIVPNSNEEGSIRVPNKQNNIPTLDNFWSKIPISHSQ